MKTYYYFKLKGDSIFFQVDQKAGVVIKFQRTTDSKNRHSIIGIVQISYISFYGRYLNWLSKRPEALFMEITKDKFQQEIKEFTNNILSQ